MDRRSLARRVYDAAHLTGEFVLRSGATSTEYFDKYLFEADPVLLADVTGALVELVPQGVDALAGLELGGVPLATMLSQATGLPARFVRKQAKTYGTCRLAEGGGVDGERLLIVEDVVTSGGAVLDAAAELRARGARLHTVLCVIDRESGGAANLEAIGLELRCLFTMTQLQEASGTGGPDASA
jgi:orotate phosphoribosyltransferase